MAVLSAIHLLLLYPVVMEAAANPDGRRVKGKVYPGQIITSL